MTVKVSSDSCEQIREMRRKFQRIDKSRLLFLDETAVRLNEARTRTVVLPGEKEYVIATDTTSYAKRYDMIACITGKEVLLPKIFTPQERADADVRGINRRMLHQFIDDTLAQAVEGLDRYPLTLVVDRASIHKGDLLEWFHNRSSYSITEVILLPSMSAKRLSPLDNALFQDWKEAVCKHGPLTLQNIQQVMSDEWNKLSPKLLAAHYRNCGLTGHKNPYFDCPAPAVHRHGR
jgi:hypothetical protein